MRNFLIGTTLAVLAVYLFFLRPSQDSDYKMDSDPNWAEEELNPIEREKLKSAISLVEKKSPTVPSIKKVAAPEKPKKPKTSSSKTKNDKKASNKDDLPPPGATVKYDAESIRMTYRVEGDYAISNGDILVAEKSKVDKEKGEIEVFGPKLWKNAQIPFVLNESQPKAKLIAQALQTINEFTEVQFIPYDGHQDYIYFTQGEGCYSYVGRIGGRQPVVLNEKCQVGNIIHELIHVIGLYHEHMRYDRDEHVKIIWSNIEPDKKNNFIKVPETFMTTHARFDIFSIMMYGSKSFAKPGAGYTVVTLDNEVFEANREGLSHLDVDKINLLYSDVVR